MASVVSTTTPACRRLIRDNRRFLALREMNELIIASGIVLLVTIVAARLYSLQRNQRRKAFLRWAASQDFRIIDYRQPILTEMSPFPIVATKAQKIFHFTAQLPRRHSQVGMGTFGQRVART
jgi:hypothetical protein